MLQVQWLTWPSIHQSLWQWSCFFINTYIYKMVGMTFYWQSYTSWFSWSLFRCTLQYSLQSIFNILNMSHCLKIDVLMWHVLTNDWLIIFQLYQGENKLPLWSNDFNICFVLRLIHWIVLVHVTFSLSVRSFSNLWDFLTF